VKGKVAYMDSPGSLVYREYDLPDPEPGAILAKVRRSNVCGSEVHIWRGLHPTLKAVVLGHEMLAEVLELGQGVSTDFAGEPLQLGDRVVCTYFRICRKCRACRSGLPNLCERGYTHWVRHPDEAPHFHGTFATHYYINPDQWVYKVPDSVPDAAAASANCALSQVMYGLDKAGLRAGETLLIQGAGGLGLNAAAVAKERGARVIVIEGVRSRLEQARSFGADYLLDMSELDSVEKRVDAVMDLTGGFGADVGIELTGVPAAFSESLRLVRPGGRYVSIGNISPGQLTPFDPGLLTRRGITIFGVIRYQPHYLLESLRFLERNGDRFPFHQLLDAEFKFEEVTDALAKSERREVTRASIVSS
jgi:threonine dehydrogenase-like Zn-dependent dehydrogenase